MSIVQQVENLKRDYHEETGVATLNGGSIFTFSNDEVDRRGRLMDEDGSSLDKIKAFTREHGVTFSEDNDTFKNYVAGDSTATLIRGLLAQHQFEPNT